MKTIAGVVLVLGVSVVFPWVCFPVCIAQDPEVDAMDAVVASGSLSKAEKLRALEKYLDKCDYLSAVLYRIQKVDWVACAGIGRRLFEAPDTSKARKYEVGRYVFDMHLMRDSGSAECRGFAKEYRDFLLRRMLDGGEAEFCTERTRITQTAVGEYAEIAGQYIGDIGKLFCDVQDPRVVDILIRCLSAPDCVYAFGEGRGEPGKPTGSNLERNRIPLALARLDASRSVPILRPLAASHPDLGMRSNAERALALIEHPEFMWK